MKKWRNGGANAFGWVEISNAALQRLRRELEERGQGVVDEMGVLAIHAGYADYFFPGTSVQQTRPRYVFFVCWNYLWLARQRSVTAANIAKKKDEADLWLTERLVATRQARALRRSSTGAVDHIIGVNVFQENPPRLPTQRIDYIYWTAIRSWGFYKSRTATNQARLIRRWKGSDVVRSGDGPDETRDETVALGPQGEFVVPPAPDGWQTDALDELDFELTGEEARWLRDRLVALDDVSEGPCVLAKAAELCEDQPPLMHAADDESRSPWDDPLVVQAANASGQGDRLVRAKQAAYLGHYVRAIYAALVERTVETTSPPTGSAPLRHYRETLRELASDAPMRDAAVALRLSRLYEDVPRIPDLLRRCLDHVQNGLRRVGAGDDPEAVFLGDDTHRLFEAVERRRKGVRARLPRTDLGASRRAGFTRDTIGVYGLDYRWAKVRHLLADLHRGLVRS
jgi:hypothetical protein